ncbi:MAG: hypothetical protein RSE57_05980 [Clostridia bacterium]
MEFVKFPLQAARKYMFSTLNRGCFLGNFRNVDRYSSIQERNVDVVVIISVGMFYTVLSING